MSINIPALMLALALAFSQQDHEARNEIERSKEEIIRLNELAGQVRSEADALALATAVSKLFRQQLPSSLTRQDVVQRVARAEYSAISSPASLIPEERIADVWNEYVHQIGAPDEAKVTPAEIHSMRDELYATGLLAPSIGVSYSVWTIPNVVAVGGDGKLADGARALEAIRVLATMDRSFENVLSARERVRKGIVASEVAKKVIEAPASSRTARLVLSTAPAVTNPVRSAEREYINEHGMTEFSGLLERLTKQLFPD